jgi:hypothetical protein
VYGPRVPVRSLTVAVPEVQARSGPREVTQSVRLRCLRVRYSRYTSYVRLAQVVRFTFPSNVRTAGSLSTEPLIAAE